MVSEGKRPIEDGESGTILYPHQHEVLSCLPSSPPYVKEECAAVSKKARLSERQAGPGETDNSKEDTPNASTSRSGRPAGKEDTPVPSDLLPCMVTFQRQLIGKVVAIRMQDTLFRCPADLLARHSPYFCKLISKCFVMGGGEVVDGAPVIEVQGDSANFAVLLNVLDNPW